MANKVNMIDLLKLLNEPLLKRGKEFRWQKHDSISFSQNKWYQHSRDDGGLPVKFLTTFFDFNQASAIDFILSHFDLDPVETNATRLDTTLVVPTPDYTNQTVLTYLTIFRLIDKHVLSQFMDSGLIYQDRKYKNCVFVGKDKSGRIRHVHKRSTNLTESTYKGNILGSDAAYSFSWIGSSSNLFVFEAPIDMLSYITLNPQDWQQHSYVALCGLADEAIHRIMHDFSFINKIVLCLDNDIPGQETNIKIQQSLQQSPNISVRIEIPKFKDFNEDLKHQYELPALEGFMTPYQNQRSLLEQELIQLSKGQKDKQFKDLVDSLSQFFYTYDTSSLKQSDKPLLALQQSTLYALLLARQQYRHFEQSYSLEDMLKLLHKEYPNPFISFDSSIDFKPFIQDIASIKDVLTTNIYFTQEDKQHLINTYMSLANRCLVTHVFLTLERNKT